MLHHRQMSDASRVQCAGAAAGAGSLSVLLVDDDDTFRRGLADNLSEDGHSVFECPTPADVPPWTLDEVNVVVTDFEMPEGNGLSFADRVHAAHPELTVVVLTANREAPLAHEAAMRGFVRLVYKPVDYQRFHHLLHAAAQPSAVVLS